MPTQASGSGRRLSDTSLNFIAANERLRPLRDVIIVKPAEVEWSRLLAGTHWRGETLRGTIVAVGPGTHWNIHTRFQKDGKDQRTVRPASAFTPTEVKVGDVVELGGKEIGGYLFKKIWYLGDWCVVATEQDVCGVHCD